ncbi:type II toxin-antitoxin system VapC family toxin [Nodosilinea sp. LEGE 07298]|uniref:type II toxin-antitoxin system VapC family toxin n=1 Tax=Nodosilinea sp. LEGE 07298 TaxID=2777970 RepID=UPI0018810F37|nr:type II toxin-antitoxin system VapC family toxin [Nodosilinea sp. LEGE 07298]MBE9107923.1 type II toxin-antitoxin system VapC family toxin [Nodosilinea sp. LEGE 07298]
MKLLFDTNIFIYHFNNQLPESGTALLREGIAGEGAYSVITRIEVLGYKQSEAAENQAKQLLSQLVELPLSSEIAERTIAIRKSLKIKVPDAIIAATALEYSLQLVSRNEDDFAQIKELILVNPFKQ